MIFDKVEKIIKRAKARQQIKRIRNSKYFNEIYYLESNNDVKAAGVDAAAHYFHYGWKENRNPSIGFSIVDFFEEFPEVKKLGVDPITYILNNKGIEKKLVNIIGKKPKVKNVLRSYFRESIPLNTLPVKTDVPRINIIFNGFDKGCFFAGKATALMLSILFSKKYHYKLRIIAQNPDRTIFNEFLDLFGIEFNEEIEFYATESSAYLEIGNNDNFICTMWSNADSVINTKAIQGKVFYIMQEVETFFYDHGDYHLRCYNTLTSESLIPIVNTKLLYDYFLNVGYENLKKGIYFEPSFSRDLLSPSPTSFKKKEKNRLLFYARPSHQRNLFYFGIDILNKAFLTGKLDENEWELYLAGDEKIPDIQLDANVSIKNLGLMTWGDYCKFASTVDLCYSMIYTPHPSYPPFDMICSGAIVVTNNYANKRSLINYSRNIISANLEEEDMLEKLKEGATLAKDVTKRKKNYLDSNIMNNWEESFKEVLPFMKEKISQKKDV